MRRAQFLLAVFTLAAAGVGFGPIVAVRSAMQNAQQAPTFEVASIKPAHGGRLKVESDPSRLTVEDTPLDTIIRLAYGLQEYQLQAPSWAHRSYFDVTGVTASPQTRPQELNMLRTLLAQRLGLVSHQEAKTMPVYLLEIGKGGSKLKPVDAPVSGPQPFDLYYNIGIESAPGGNSQFHALTGMPVFADFLTRLAQRPVLDHTGLQGRYNVRLLCAIDGYPGSDTSPTVFQALPDQLGLTLTAAQAPVQITVIDHLLPTPIGN